MLLTLLPLLAFFAPPDAPIPAGTNELVLRVGDKDITVFTYKPKADSSGPLVLVFHGINRNASEYRDWSKVIADRTGGIVAAPLFDKERFPTSAYQMGNLMKEKTPRPEAEWTWSLVPKIADALRAREGRKEMPYYLIGHSAGGQFLNRLAGFVKTDAQRIVAANPGSLLWPGEEMPFPYGFGELPGKLGGDDVLKRYLAQPLTLYLGTADTVRDENFPTGEFPEKQGSTRHARGTATFNKAEALAKEKGWPFHWRKVEAGGVGHSSEKMFKHDHCLDALGWKSAK